MTVLWMKPSCLFLSSRTVFLLVNSLTLVCCLYERDVMVMATGCPDIFGALPPQETPPGYRMTYSNCDEVSEYNSIVQLHRMVEYRVFVLIVSFPANCRAVGIVYNLVRQPVILFLVGCEEVARSTGSAASSLITIQMTPPSWYPTRIFRHLATNTARSSRVLLASPDCDQTSFQLLRDSSRLINQYVPITSDPLNVPAEFSHIFGCLSRRELRAFPVINDFKTHSLTLFVKDVNVKSNLQYALEDSAKLLDLVRSATDGSIFTLSYVANDNNDTESVFLQDVRKSLVLAAALLRQSDKLFENSTVLSSRTALALIDYSSTAHVLLTSAGFFHLPPWTITALGFLNDTLILQDKATVTADPVDRVLLQWSTINRTLIPANYVVTPGFRFTELYNWSSDPTSDSSHSGPNILGVYVPIAVAACVLVALILLLGICLRRHFIKTQMSKDRVKFYIDNDDLTPISKRSNTTLSVNSTTNSRSTNGHVYDGGGKSFASLKTADSDPIHELGFASGDNYAKLNGDIVFLRYIRTKTMQLKSSSRNLVNNMRDLRGDNINGFVAFFIGHHSPFKPPAVVFEYCSRGSLMDLIDKEEIKLDWSFKVSFLTDIVRGLKVIHNSAVKYHGRMTSRKCVIDTRWTLKITDYAINRLELYQNNEKVVGGMPDERLYWTAPELLRNELLMREGTPKGDIYSFAIIMQELIIRGRPFCTTELTAAEVINKVRHPPPLLRPHVPNQTAQPEAIAIMKECWAENPDVRPTIDEVVAKFKVLNQGRKTNIVDSMFAMLEKYSNNLEELIHERTEELNEEKKKTEQLLFRMMPRTVAEKLKTGEAVEPETFAEVTIYFSDIVGFTTISAYSNPMEIVNLLNDLYSMFDTILSYYDVYKVETIGDAYMVVSGLPLKNGDKHAGEIATVALELLHHCGKFKIRHMCEVPLFLRIGVHTGSCAAGVVGLTMPRYCLFGDTVNTASRMESTSRAYRIHLSDTSHTLLEKLTGYRMEYRGVIQVKGKGEMKTYWLSGKDGYEKWLPEPAPDTGDNHGIDEKMVIRGKELQKQKDAEIEKLNAHKKSDGSHVTRQASVSISGKGT